MTTKNERLQKVVANAGIASRRHAETLIASGHVKVNGHVTTEMGIKIGPHDTVEVDGVPIGKEAKRYFLFYKPRGVISAVEDNKGRKVVTDYFEDVQERLYPVGRLDYDTSGLLVMTNDGELANHLMHPRYALEKKYVAKVEGIPNRPALAPLKTGVSIDGKMTAPAKVEILSTDKAKKTAIVALTIHQGMNHQVKKMFKAVGFPVIKLSREAYGNLTLAGLQPGEHRPIKPQELHDLRQLTGEQEEAH